MRSRFIENCPGEADSKEDENNMNDTNLTIRPMTIDDFEQVHSLWMEIHGFGIRSVDDSKAVSYTHLTLPTICSV